jgi:hypothetical protein
MEVGKYNDCIVVLKNFPLEAFTPVCKYGTLSFSGCCGHCLLTSEVSFRFSNL